MTQIKPIPDGLHTLTPQLNIDGAAAAMALYTKAFGAEEIARAPDPSGTKIWHAEMRVGDSAFFVNDTFPEMGATANKTCVWLYSANVDAAFKRATEAGAKARMPLSDMFWGDRMATVVDPWGNEWTLAQRVKNLTREEMQAAQETFVASLKKG